MTAQRIAAWQIAVVLGFAAVGRGWAAGLAVGLAAAGLLAVSAVRIHGVWLSTVAARGVFFALRRRVHAGVHLPLPAGTTIAPDGVLLGADGLTAVARTRGFEIPALAADADGPALDLQLVVHRGPRQAGSSAWLAVSVRRDTDACDDATLRVTLGNTLRRLRRSGHELSALSAPDLREVLSGLAHAGPARESWRSWRSGSSTQITLRLGATAGQRPEIDRLLAEGRDADVTVAVRAGGDGVLRVAATSPAAADRAATRLVTVGAHLGVRLHRLDGLHGPAVTASLPIGETLC